MKYLYAVTSHLCQPVNFHCHGGLVGRAVPRLAPECGESKCLRGGLLQERRGRDAVLPEHDRHDPTAGMKAGWRAGVGCEVR